MERTEGKCSVLCVTQSEKTAAGIRAILPGGFGPFLSAASMAEAKRRIGSDGADILIICSPLPDESGVRSAKELAVRFPSLGILLIVKKEIYEETVYRTEGTGILVLGRPSTGQSVVQALSFLRSMHDRIVLLLRENEKLTRRLQDERLVSRAKGLLIAGGMNEQEAHRWIERKQWTARLQNGKSRSRSSGTAEE